MKLKNIRPNFHVVETPYVDIYFSYETPIAFQELGQPLVVRENEWGPTTGKHLNTLQSDKKLRVSGEQFELALVRTLA